MREKMDLPRGPVLFAPGTPRRRRRARLAFLVVYLVTAAALTWPVYPLFAGPRPQLLGLPLSFAWPVLWLAVMFAALAALYRVDHGGEGDPAAPPRETPGGG